MTTTFKRISIRWKIFYFSLFICFNSMSQTIWTFGPMLHVNFGGERTNASFGFELAYWNFSHFPYSYDFGTDFSKKRIRLYSECQTGFGLAGIAAGPVLEIQTDKPAIKLGLQTSIWGNYYLGFDLRFRFIDKKTFFCPGTYFKFGVRARDENGEKIKHSSSFDFDD